MKKLITTFSLALLTLAATAQTTATIDGIKYTLDGSTATVTYPNDSEPGTSEYTGDIVIPAALHGTAPGRMLADNRR